MGQEKITIGIACDMYKLTQFGYALKAEGYEYTYTKGIPTPGNCLIRVKTYPSSIPTIGEICKKLEIQFQAQRN